MTDLTAEDIKLAAGHLDDMWDCMAYDDARALRRCIAAAERDLELRSEAHTLTLCGNCGCGVRPSLAIEIAGKPWCRECVQEWVDLREARDAMPITRGSRKARTRCE